MFRRSASLAALHLRCFLRETKGISCSCNRWGVTGVSQGSPCAPAEARWWILLNSQKGLEVCYCLWVCHPDPRLGPIPGPSRSHPGSEGVPSRFAMCFVFQHFGPIQVPRWGPPRPVLVPSWSRVFFQDRAWTGRNRLLGHFRKFAGTFCGKVRGKFGGFFWTPKNRKAQTFWGKFGTFFDKKFVAQKKKSCQNSLCRRAALTQGEAPLRKSFGKTC